MRPLFRGHCGLGMIGIDSRTINFDFIKLKIKIKLVLILDDSDFDSILIDLDSDSKTIDLVPISNFIHRL